MKYRTFLIPLPIRSSLHHWRDLQYELSEGHSVLLYDGVLEKYGAQHGRVVVGIRAVEIVEKVPLQNEESSSPGGVPRGLGARLPHNPLLVEIISQPQFCVCRLQEKKSYS